MLLQCDRWANERRHLHLTVGQELAVEMLVATMISGREIFQNIRQFIKPIVSRKETDDRAVIDSAVIYMLCGIRRNLLIYIVCPIDLLQVSQLMQTTRAI